MGSPGLLPRIRYNAAVQTLFDLFVQEKSRFNRVLQVRGNLVVIYDPADEIISLPCSSFPGILYLLHETLTASSTPPKPKSRWWLWQMAEIFRRSCAVATLPDQLLAQIPGVISARQIHELHHKLTSIFEFVKLVDLDARIDESQTLTLRRAASFRVSTRDICAQVGELLKKTPSAASRGGYNDKEGLMLKAFTQETNGLSEVVIKFVKFMHRMEVCTLSAFDLFCPKAHDPQMLKVFFWAFWFMHRFSQLRSDPLADPKFSPSAIVKGYLNSHRQLRAQHPRLLRKTGQLPRGRASPFPAGAFISS